MATQHKINDNEPGPVQPVTDATASVPTTEVAVPPPAAKRRGRPPRADAAEAGVNATEPFVKPRRARKAKPTTPPGAQATVALRVTMRSDGYTSVYDRRADLPAADLETTVRKWLRSCRRR